MNLKKVKKRLVQIPTKPELLEHVARDVGFAAADADRQILATIASHLAKAAGSGKKNQDYWAGFATALGMFLASYEAGFEQRDAEQYALQCVKNPSIRATIEELNDAPQTGKSLALQLGLSPSATSKILTSLREMGIARVLGGRPYPKRGAPKPHALTPLGEWLAKQINTKAEPSHERIAGNTHS